jgi:hypothetical protein
VPRYRGVRAEFRRRTHSSPWVLAGVWLDERFLPVSPEVEPVRWRLPDAGLVGWTELPTPVVAPDRETAIRAALDVARAAWPQRDRLPVPWPFREPAGRTGPRR